MVTEGQPFYPGYITKYQKDFSSIIIKEDIDSGVKADDKEWYRNRGEWLMANYLGDGFSTRYSDVQNYIESRQYAAGNQPNTKYMNILCPLIKAGKKRGKRRNWMNISWDIFPVYVRIRNKVLGYMMDFEYRINAYCQDELSDADRNEIKTKLLLKQEHGEFMKWVQEQMGIPDNDNQDLPFNPSSAQEIEMIDMMGGFKLWQEIAMEIFCSRSFSISNWEEISKRLKEDIIDLAICITKDYLDPITMEPKVRYCDPVYTIVNKSINPSNEQVSEGGEILFFSAGELLRQYPKITKEEMVEAIEANGNSWGNERFDFGKYNGWHDSMNAAKIAVLDFEFLSINQDKFTVSKNDRGVESVAKKSVEYNGADAKTTYEPTWYQACWIIGTKVVYNYGVRQNAPYTWNSDKCNSSFTMYRAGDRSITDVCKATIDQLMITVYKTRNAEIKARPSGVAVNWTSLLGMTHGGDELKPFDMLDIAQQTGNILLKGPTDQRGNPLQGAVSPISELNGGIGQYLTELITLYQKSMNELNDLTGIASVINGSNPENGQGLGLTRIAETAVNDIFRPALYAYKNVKKRSTENITMRWQMLALFHPEVIRKFANETSPYLAQILTTGSEFAFYKYGIDFDSEVSPQIIIDIKNAALESMRAGKAGQPGITQADYMFIVRQLERGNLKYIQMYLSYREKQSYEQIQATQQQNMELNAKSAQDLEKQKAASEAQALQAELMLKTAVIEKESQARLMEQNAKFNGEMELQRQKYIFEMQLQDAAPKPVAASSK